ncbi:MAG: PAS domain S-box protein [Bacteroidia bacterium]|nr:PAS domain S-box protein [Bacteroidia bacterium]
MDSIDKFELIDTLFNHATEGIIVADTKGSIRLANHAAAGMLGYTSEELQQLVIEDLIPDSIRGKHHHYRENYHQHAHSRPMGVGLDLYARKKTGDLMPVEISLSPIEVKKERLIIAFIIDITFRKQIELAVQDKQKELERVAAALIATNEELEKKVSARTKVLQEAIRELERSRNELSLALEKAKDLNDLKSRFISMASHEFRTPLTTILSSASLISEYVDSSSNEKRIKHINRIKSAVNNLNDILSDFLSISKLEEGKVHAEYRTFELPALANEVVSDFHLTAKAGQVIAYEHKGNNSIYLDSKLLKNILINLISNAIKFTAEHKTIQVRTRVDAFTISLEVEDQGIGISDEDQKHLFERFYRGKNAFNIQGTGLGLHIVGNYVDLMKGHIMLHSEIDKGTTIKITFPNQAKPST